MESLKRKASSWLPLFLLIVASLALAAEPLPPISEWIPDNVSATVPPDRANPFALLQWKRKPVFNSTDRFTVLGIEAELIFPELKRVGAEQYYPTNKLQFTKTPNLPASCYYQDTPYKDHCENWALGIDTSPECLLAVLPKTITINYRADALPPEATTGRYQIQTVGVDKGDGSFNGIAGWQGNTVKAQRIGLACTIFCAGCYVKGGLPVIDNSKRELCVALAREIENPYATWEWLEAFCPSCEEAKNAAPAWRNFFIDGAVCAEPVAVPGTTTGAYCSRATYSDGCDPVNPKPRICQPGTPRCTGKVVETCSADATAWEQTMSCDVCCRGNMCQGTYCSPNSSFCIDQDTRQTCSSDGCSTAAVRCDCGCDNGTCPPKVCTSSYCRDANTQILCSNSGCSTIVVPCGYGCMNGQCQGSGGTPVDMATGGTPPDLASPPRDFAGPPTPEVCNGIDDDKNGIVDDPAGCWLTVYRFRDPATNARCYGPTNIAPPVCSGYVFETVLFSAPTAPWADGHTAERVQCSKGTNHIITIKGGGEYANLQGMGWSCNVTLGYWFATGYGPQFPVRTPFAYTCPVYRSWYTTTGGTSHIFSGQNESFFGTFTCEPPTRGEVVQNVACGKPSGC
jgi:hypothetical protein